MITETKNTREEGKKLMLGEKTEVVKGGKMRK